MKSPSKRFGSFEALPRDRLGQPVSAGQPATVRIRQLEAERWVVDRRGADKQTQLTAGPVLTNLRISQGPSHNE